MKQNVENHKSIHIDLFKWKIKQKNPKKNIR